MMRVAVAGAVSPAVALRDRAGPFAGGLERRRPNASRAPTRGFKAKGRVVVAVVRASSHGDDAKAVGIDTSALSPASTVEAAEGPRHRTTGSGARLPGGYDSARARAGLLAQISDAKTADKKETKKKSGDKSGATASKKGSKTTTEKMGKKGSNATNKSSAAPKTIGDFLTYLPVNHPLRKPWTPYPWDKPGIAGYDPRPISDLKYCINGNALMQVDRQTIPYNQFIRDLTAETPTIKELWWQRDGLDRYLLVYHDDRVAYVQVPVDEWKTSELINRAGLEIQEIIDDTEADATGTGIDMGAKDSSALLFTNYGVPLIGVGIVWFIVWSMNRFKGDFDDRQKMMEIERREEAMKKVEGDISLKLLQTKIDAIDKETDPDGYKQAQKALELSLIHISEPTRPY